jgi:membrane protease YdiL (CAAX protease family)
MSRWADAVFAILVVSALAASARARRTRFFEAIRSGTLQPSRAWSRILGAESALLATTLAFLWVRGATPHSFGARIPGSDQAIAGSFVLVFFLLALLNLGARAKPMRVSSASGPFLDPQAISIALRPRTRSGWLLWAAVCVVTAVSEELFFRGVLCGRLAEISSSTLAAFVSSTAFGAIHVQFPWRTRLALMFVGGAFAGLFFVGGGLVCPTIAHLMWNLYVGGALGRRRTGARPGLDSPTG